MLIYSTLIACSPSFSAHADEVSDLKNQMQTMETQHQDELRKLQARLELLETQEKTRLSAASASQSGGTSLEKRLTTLEEAAKKVPAFERFAKINWYADFRLRYEAILNRDNAANEHRDRGQFRLGATYPVSDELEFGARLSTGGSSGDSAFVTLGDRFNKDDFQLDRYYFRYRPVKQASIWGGKFENPFWVTQATWDNDLQPEGAAAMYTFKNVAGIDEISTRGGFFTASEIDADNDSTMWGSQIVATDRVAKDWTAETGFADYLWHKISPLTVTTNATNTDGSYASDFKELDWISRVTYEGWKWPISGLFEYGRNLGASDKIGNNLYWAEASVGKLKKPLDWELKYEFAYIQQDAVLADFAGNNTTPETNTVRHGFYANMRVIKNTDLGLTYIAYERLEPTRTSSTADENTWSGRLRIDLTTKF